MDYVHAGIIGDHRQLNNIQASMTGNHGCLALSISNLSPTQILLVLMDHICRVPQ